MAKIKDRTKRPTRKEEKPHIDEEDDEDLSADDDWVSENDWETDDEDVDDSDDGQDDGDLADEEESSEEEQEEEQEEEIIKDEDDETDPEYEDEEAEEQPADEEEEEDDNVDDYSDADDSNSVDGGSPKLNRKILNEAINHDVEPRKPSSKTAKVDEYEVDSSDEEDIRNNIGNIPVEWYLDYPHIGYDLKGDPILKPKQGDLVDDFLKRMDDPFYWRTIRDKKTAQDVLLTDADVELIRRVARNQYPDPKFDPYGEWSDHFTRELSIHPATNRPETKASFIPSKAEKKKISNLVKAIKAGRIKLDAKKPKKHGQFTFNYDLWEKEEKPNQRLRRYVPAPKLKPPTHAESYNPPPEYLFTPEELAKWKEQEPWERRLNYIPQKYNKLRHVPAYPDYIQERFERCLDLYLCPRVRKLKAQVDPEQLLPKLPRPKDLQPFPNAEAIVYRGHEGPVRSIDVEPTGQYMLSGSDDGMLKVWEVFTGRCMASYQFDGPVSRVKWCPDRMKCLVAVVVDSTIYLVNTGISDKLVVSGTDDLFAKPEEAGSDEEQENDALAISEEENEEGDQDPTMKTQSSKRPTRKFIQWEVVKKNSPEWKKGIRVIIRHRFEVRQVTWHGKGDYFAVVMPDAGNRSVVVHQVSKRRSQMPFKKAKGTIVHVLFHPSKPYMFVATKINIRIYNLAKKGLIKKLQPNCRQLSSMDIHPGGDNIIIGSLDLRLSWFDLDLRTTPYKTMRYHKKAIRQVHFHPKYPLMASGSDDGTVVISHAMVYNDLMTNPLIVPLKMLPGQKPNQDGGVMDCVFHPLQPWIFACGADKTIKLFSH